MGITVTGPIMAITAMGTIAGIMAATAIMPATDTITDSQRKLLRKGPRP